MEADDPNVAFVLGGGGQRGSFEVGMLKALLARGVRPDVVIGTSVGAFNGAAVASSPTDEMVAKLEEAWMELSTSAIFAGSFFSKAANVVRQRTHLFTNTRFRELLEATLPVRTFEELEVPFHCVAASIEEAAERWFSSGPLIEPILASSAVPGLLPPVEIEGVHYVDGGVVNSIPVSHAVDLGASEIYVLHVGHIEEPLEVPVKPWEVAMVAFEISRRHRFERDLAAAESIASVHVLPTGNPDRKRFSDPSKLRYSDFSAVKERIGAAFAATSEYLDAVENG